MRRDAQSRCKGPHPANQGTTPQKPASQLQAPDANETLTGGLQLPPFESFLYLFSEPCSALPSGDNLELQDWRRTLSDMVLYTRMLNTASSDLQRDSTL